MSNATPLPTHSSAKSALMRPLQFALTAVQRMQQRRELGRLLVMTEHELKDIGLPRHEIVQEIVKPFWRA
jgi:uncharacterized protein YjiS (DUF1127 family)